MFILFVKHILTFKRTQYFFYTIFIFKSCDKYYNCYTH